MESDPHSLTSRAALAELDRVGEVVRARSRWYGQFLLALGGGTVAYYAAVNVVAPTVPTAVGVLALCWTGFMLLLAGWARRRPVTWRGIRRIRTTLMPTYYMLVAVTVLLNVTVLRDLPGRWALGIIPALPCLLGAWAVLRR